MSFCVVGLCVLAAVAFFWIPTGNRGVPPDTASAVSRPVKAPTTVQVTGSLSRGETLTDLFRKESLNNHDLFGLIGSCDGVFDLRDLKAGRRYRIEMDEQQRLLKFSCEIDDHWSLVVEREESGFRARKDPIPYTVRPVLFAGEITDTLVGALGATAGPDRIAIALSEIFSWDIDFATDLRAGDTFEFVVEEKRFDDGRIRYGRILSARFTNNGHNYHAAYFRGTDGRGDYYDEQGRPLRRGFLSSPLRYKYISSRFSRNRLHPILKIRRPHLGVDYAAPAGTPVSASGDGTVVFAGRKGGFGRLVTIRHPGGYRTYYGHLSRFGKGIRRGRKVVQGQIIGYVGSSGLSTGPHLDYRVKRNGTFIDPLKLKAIRKPPLKGEALARFKKEYDRLRLLEAGAFFVRLAPADERGGGASL